jgi:hypothetical protein
VGERTGRRWAADGPPDAVAKFLRLMDALQLTADRVRQLLGESGRWMGMGGTRIEVLSSNRGQTSFGIMSPRPDNRLRIPSATQPWLRSDLLFLSLSLGRGMPPAEVAGFLGRSEDEVREKAQQLGHSP